MPPEQFKTQAIQILSEGLSDVRRETRDLGDRLNEVEIQQGKTIVHCKNIYDKLESAEKANEKKDLESGVYRKGIKDDLAEIMKSMQEKALESAEVKTRWSLLGKPIWTSIIGGGVALMLKLMFDHMTK